jgi:hypothetical protein
MTSGVTANSRGMSTPENFFSMIELEFIKKILSVRPVE